jgi:hypothetical protein
VCVYNNLKLQNWFFLPGASHGDDADFVTQVAYSNTEEMQQDKDMSKVLVDIWDSFSRNGYEWKYYIICF